MSGVSYSAGAVVGGGLLTVPGLWWAGLWVLIPIFSSSSFRFSSRGSEGAVVSTPPWGPLVYWSNRACLSGSTPGALDDQSKIFVRGRCYKHPEQCGVALLCALIVAWSSFATRCLLLSTMAENSLSVTTCKVLLW